MPLIMSFATFIFQSCIDEDEYYLEDKELVSNTFTKAGIKYAFVDNSYFAVVGYNNSIEEDCAIYSTIHYKASKYRVKEIRSYAFKDCQNLKSIFIPTYVEKFGPKAFVNCTNLSTITVDTLNAHVCAYDGILYDITKKTLLMCPTNHSSYNILNGVKYIADDAFSNCSGLTNITIPNSVTSIGKYAFSGCTGLTSVTIPNFVKSIENQAFQNCSGLTTVEYNAVNCKGVSSSSDAWFKDCPLKTMKIGSKVEFIPAYMAYGQKGIGSITIPNSVTSIGGSAFYGCSGLTSITIPSSVTSIGTNAFSNCTGLTNINIPNGVKSIGDCAFQNCLNLTQVSIPASVTSASKSVFEKCPIVNAYVDSPNFCSSVNWTHLENLEIGNSVTEIKDYAFEKFGGSLQTVKIGNSVKKIGNYAFYWTKLTSAHLGKSVETIGKYAFCPIYVSKLSLNIPNSVTTIETGAFYETHVDIKCYAINPPKATARIFNSNYNSVVHVYAKYESLYKNTSFWRWPDVTVVGDL